MKTMKLVCKKKLWLNHNFGKGKKKKEGEEWATKKKKSMKVTKIIIVLK